MIGPFAWRPVRLLLALQGFILLAVGVLLAATGLAVAAEPAWLTFYLLACGLFLLLAAFYGLTGRSQAIAHTLLALLLLINLVVLCTPLNYALFALPLPLVDGWLAGADALLGFHVPAIVAWIQARLWLDALSVYVYGLVGPLMPIVAMLLGLWLRDFRSLWEFVFHYQFTALAVAVLSAFTPAAGAYVWYDYVSSIDQSRVIRHFFGLRDGSLDVLRFPELAGLVSFPSFHACAAVVTAHALRRHPFWFWPCALLCAGVVVSTVTTGAHYVIDIPAGLAVFGLSVVAYKRWVTPDY